MNFVVPVALSVIQMLTTRRILPLGPVSEPPIRNFSPYSVFLRTLPPAVEVDCGCRRQVDRDLLHRNQPGSETAIYRSPSATPTGSLRSSSVKSPRRRVASSQRSLAFVLLDWHLSLARW